MKIKSFYILPLIALINFTSCKKEEGLTKEDLDQAISNIPSDNLPGWESFKSAFDNGGNFNYKNTSKNFIQKDSQTGTLVIDNYIGFEFKTRNSNHELVMDLDTNKLFPGSYSQIVSWNNTDRYLVKMYSQNKFYDVLDIIEASEIKAVFYSRELDEFIITEKL